MTKPEVGGHRPPIYSTEQNNLSPFVVDVVQSVLHLPQQEVQTFLGGNTELSTIPLTAFMCFYIFNGSEYKWFVTDASRQIYNVVNADNQANLRLMQAGESLAIEPKLMLLESRLYGMKILDLLNLINAKNVNINNEVDQIKAESDVKTQTKLVIVKSNLIETK